MTLLKIILLFFLFCILIVCSLSFEYHSNIQEEITVHLLIDDIKKEIKLPKGSTYTILNNYLDLDDYVKNYQDDYLLGDGELIELKKIKSVPVSINKADVDLLAGLPGIGEKTAEKIVKFRETNGPFKCLEDLMLVPGIKEKKYEQLKEYISI